jgi:MYXO-CTERM domain-containing protein
VVEAAGTVCRAGSGDGCDPEEICSGNVGEACPTDVVEPDGTTCNDGVCMSGMCGPEEMGGAGGTGQGGGATGGSGGDTTSTGGSAAGGEGGEDGGGGEPPPDDDGCSCRVAGAPSPARWPASLLALLALVVVGRRRRD